MLQKLNTGVMIKLEFKKQWNTWKREKAEMYQGKKNP